MNADELTIVLRWLTQKALDLRRQAEPLKGDLGLEALWNSGLLEAIVHADEWRGEVIAQLQAMPPSAQGREGGDDDPR